MFLQLRVRGCCCPGCLPCPRMHAPMGTWDVPVVCAVRGSIHAQAPSGPIAVPAVSSPPAKPRGVVIRHPFLPQVRLNSSSSAVVCAPFQPLLRGGCSVSWMCCACLGLLVAPTYPPPLLFLLAAPHPVLRCLVDACASSPYCPVTGTFCAPDMIRRVFDQEGV
jgi:hypothetical protein